MLLLFLVLFMFLAFFLAFLLFKRIRPEKSPINNPLFWLSGIVMTPVLLVGSLFFYMFISSIYIEKAFDEIAWKTENHNRYIYVTDLKENKLIGMDSLKVIQLLGPPDDIDNGDLIYNIGYDPKQYFNMDPDWMYVKIRAGKVQELEVKR